jgi:Lsr2
MATRTIVELVDDLDGKPIKQGEGETVNFGLDNVEYTIDVSKANADKLRQALSSYVQAARTVSRRGRRSGTQRGRAARDREQIKAIREWARQNGYKVSARGRIPGEIQEAYDKSQ